MTVQTRILHHNLPNPTASLLQQHVSRASAAMWSSRGICCLAVCHLVVAQLQPVLPPDDKENQCILRAIEFPNRLSVVKHFIIFLGENSNSSSNMLPKLLADRYAAAVTMIGKQLNSLEGFTAGATVLVIFYSNLNDHIMQAIGKSLYAYYYVSFVFVHKSELGLPLNNREREALFNWCRLQSLLKVLLIECDCKGYQYWVPQVNANSQRARSKLVRIDELKTLERRDIWKNLKQQGFHLTVSAYENFPIAYVVSTYLSISYRLHRFFTLSSTTQRGEVQSIDSVWAARMAF